jgi:2-dehydropantoate 2-reductase
MRIAIFGTGGAGGYFGAHLARAGEEVAFLARGEHLEAIRRDGLRVETVAGEILARGVVASDPAELGPVDVVILGVKTWQIGEAARAMGPLFSPETFVVPLQNGVEATGELAAILGLDRVLVGMCATLSRVVAPGRIESLGALNWIRFGELDNTRSARAERLLAAFTRAGVHAEIPDDLEVALWQKFLGVVSLGAVGMVTRAPIGVVRGQPETRVLLERAMREIFAVGRARGVALADDQVERTLEAIDRLDPNGTTSLQRDLAEGRPSELEAWSGAVVRLGRAAGVATPVHEFAYSAMLPQERRARGELAFNG